MSAPVPTAETPSTRWHFMDALRAFLMLVGIPYHSARFFRGDLALLDQVATFSNLWRMTTFFVVAGFFALMIARRRGPAPWFRGRLTRLGVPLVFCVLVLNPWQTYMLIGERRAERRLTSSAWPWIHHAWFLLYLLIYCAVLALLLILAGRLLNRVLDVSSRVVLASPTTLTLAALTCGVVAAAAQYRWVQAGWEEATYDALTPLLPVHLLSFAAGVLLAAGGGHLGRIASLARGPVVLLALGGTAVVLLEPLARETEADKAVHTGVATAAGLAWAAVWMRIFGRWCTRDTTLVRWLISASLPVYLVHHVVVFGFGPVVVEQGWHPWTGFGVLTVVVTAVAFAAYELANLTTPTRMLLSGDRRRGVSLYDVLRGSRPAPAPTRVDDDAAPVGA
ncbi:MAG: acyltransferase family protein [Nocardioides sp.]|uniref:acyltransferase family protein n=1 Tax=Nocardioides sp. TaxID=35761 RepID=UPI003EFF4CE5